MTLSEVLRVVAEGARPGDRVDDQPAEKPKQRGTKRPRTGRCRPWLSSGKSQIMFLLTRISETLIITIPSGYAFSIIFRSQNHKCLQKGKFGVLFPGKLSHRTEWAPRGSGDH